jgi:hypothetical protein
MGVKIMKAGLRLEDTPLVQLPSPNLRFSSAEPTIVNIDTNTAKTVVNPEYAEKGSSSEPANVVVKVEDNRISGTSADSYLYVSKPDNLKMAIRPSREVDFSGFNRLDMGEWSKKL